MRIKKHLLNERVITIGNIPEGEEKTVKYDDWYFVISHAYDEDEDYEYTVYVTDSLTSKEYQYVYACENREEMMDYIARFLKNHKTDKEPEWDGEFNESKSYIKDAKKKIGEIVNKNGDIIKENYNRYLSPFMISPIIIWYEHDEIFDEIYDTLVGNGPTPTYARLANYDIKPLSNEYQQSLDTEIICLCATIDNHMLKVGIMFDDDPYSCLMACGFIPNGDGTWEINGENYSQEKAEKYYLDEYIKPSIGIARRRLNEIHTVFDGEIYNNEKSYWGDIIFGNSGNDTEPDDAGDEYDESYNPMLKEEASEYDPDWMKTPLGSDDYGIFSYGGYDLYINCYYDRDDEDNYYDLLIMRQKTNNTLYEFGTNNWDELIDEIKDYVKKHSDTEPEDDGSELNETVEGNSSWETNPPQEIGESIKFKVGLTSYEAVFTRDNGFKKFYDLRIFELDYDNVWTTVTFDDWDDLVRWAKRYARKDTSEPEWNGEFDELDESWLPGAEWLDEPTPIGYSETHFYKGYDFVIEGIRDGDDEYYSLRVFIHDITDDDDALVRQESFDTWDELAFYVRDYVDEHPIKPDKKDDDTEPEDTGDEYDELNESKDNYKWYEKAPEIGDQVRVDEENYAIFIKHIYLDPDDDEDEEIDDDEREYFKIEIGKKLDEESVYVVDKKIGYKWEDCVRYVKKYLNTIIKEPETDGSELNETKIVPPEYDDDFSNEWKHNPLYAGEEVTYNYKGYELFIDASVEDEYGEITYTLDIYNKGGHKKLVEASFVDWDKLVEYVDDFIYNDSEADPEEDGSELDERFDMNTIKKQINEIVNLSDG